MVWGVFFGLWGYLELLWGFLGAPGRPKTKKGKSAHVFGGDLGGSWGGLGGLLGHLGVQDGAKTPKKSMPKSIENLMPLGIGILSDFIGILEGKWKQVGTKIVSKIDVNCESQKPTKR